ncbi:MAG: PEP-CTERM sorting domain-containing protein [Pirellulaceae bacterium]
MSTNPKFFRLAAAVICLSLMVSLANGDTVNIRWAGTASVSGLNATGAPNGVGSATGGGAEIQVSNFQSPTTYVNLAALLGVSEALLNSADCIAFDVQAAGPPGQGAGVLNGFESVRFFSTDTINGVFTNHDETNANLLPGILATGTLTPTQMQNYFGTTVASFNNSWILFDLGQFGINKHSHLFTTRIYGGADVFLPGEGTPDIDAFGVFSSVPEPTGAGLIALAGLGVSFIRRRSNHGVK